MSVSNFLGIAASNISLVGGIAASNISLMKGIEWGTSAAADPQLQFFENFPGHLGAAYNGYSNGTLSVHAVNIPLSISFNKVVALMSVSSAALSALSGTIQFGLYSLNAGTLSLANSASGAVAEGGSANSWYSMATSATQNISPGAWYFGVNFFTGGIATDHSSASFYGNSSVNLANAVPGGFLMGRMTASTNAMPSNIATSDLDITGSDATRQPYIILTA